MRKRRLENMKPVNLREDIPEAVKEALLTKYIDIDKPFYSDDDEERKSPFSLRDLARIQHRIWVEWTRKLIAESEHTSKGAYRITSRQARAIKSTWDRSFDDLPKSKQAMFIEAVQVHQAAIVASLEMLESLLLDQED